MIVVEARNSIGQKFHLRRWLISCLSVLALVSCVSTDIEDWPATVPPQEIFVAAYANDAANQRLQSEAEYLGWTLSFYQGNIASPTGWEDVEEYLIESPKEVQDQRLRRELRELGIAIGSEWSRHNDIRLIDTRLLSLWASTIQLAGDYETQQQSIEIIAADVDALLSGEMEKSDIANSHYDELLGLDSFGDF